ncbi:DUF6460 domain-containing protein [Maritalea mediterranea]|uniref:DUF6460 domain-containing protein n=1 Tax=Maritalea mediterranea TaxID=2909667 RepID=A0ABS9E796_9HYPH|nr:DUF6460 domain-containing protein [Maritalea mediterranea]MCF4097650.1 DUF6460 domain-containing protein [Maritalea mediterranea]
MPERDHIYDADDHKDRRDSSGRQFLKLVLASLLVGFVMYQSGLTPGDIFGGFGRWIGSIFSDFGTTFATVAVWFAYGAAVVFPLWIIIRILKSFK